MGKWLILFLISTQSLAVGIKLNWNPNQEPDLQGYKIHYGFKTRHYTLEQDVGKTNSYELTSLQANTEYFLALTAYDSEGNESSYSEELHFKLGDTRAPKLSGIYPLSSTELQIRFDETLDPISSQEISNYHIENGPEITDAVLQSDRKTVHLKTTHHSDGQYTMVISNIYDINLPGNHTGGVRADYTFGKPNSDNTPPTLVMARAENAQSVLVHFSEPVDPSTALRTDSYAINQGINVVSVEQGETDNAVILSTTEHSGGLTYTLTVNSVTDTSENKNTIQPNSTYSYTFDPGDVVGPVLLLVNIIDATTLEVMFNEPIEKSGAETAANYSIDQGITVSQATLDASRQIVRLKTSEHIADKTYKLRVSNIRDASENHNPMTAGNEYSYLFAPEDRTGPTIVRLDVIDESTIRVVFSERVTKSSAEEARFYQIDGDVHVLNATLDVSGQSVTLVTTPHQTGQQYTIQISQITDLSPIGNEIIPNSAYTYTVGEQSSGVGPTLVQVDVNNASELLLTFSKPLERNSAETAQNYTLNRNTQIHSATLDETGTIVTLQTSPHEPNAIYILTVNHVKCAAEQIPINTNTSYSYLFQGTDAIGPMISMVQMIDAEHIDVLFNEPVTRETAEALTHYEISGGVNVLEARLAGSHQVVHLTTEKHLPNKLYILRVNGISDKSPAGNLITPNTSYAYLYESEDQNPPTLAMVKVMDATHIQVAFSEAVKASIATNPEHYELSNDASVLGVQETDQAHLYIMETTPLIAGRIYILMVSEIHDMADNPILPNSSYTFHYGAFDLNQPPQVIKVNTLASNRVRVEFDQPLDRTSAENPQNYLIQGGIQVQQAVLDTSLKVVDLTTTSHQAGKLYVLFARDIGRQENAGLSASIPQPFFYMHQTEPEQSPRIKSVQVLGDMLIKVSFDKAVDRLSAENRRNYYINNNVIVLSAELDMDGHTVLLETSRHKAGLAYALTVAGIRAEMAGMNVVFTNSTYAYTFLPNLQVNVEGMVETGLSYLDLNEPYYIDRNYVVTSIPEELKHVKLLMTSNNDRANTDSRYMTLKLSQPAFVYIAYDSRAVTVPNWLDAHFNKTGQSIQVTDNARELDLWRGYFEYGTVTLGGNNATGARGVQSMYVVLIKEPDLNQMGPGGRLDGTEGISETIPETVVLHPNYPNPFNPTTTISFEIPYSMQVQVKIFNVLGQEVRTLYDEPLTGGVYKAVWDGLNNYGQPVSAGLYFYRLQAWENKTRNGMTIRENHIEFIKKMTFLK
jgi:hypothetical protein